MAYTDKAYFLTKITEDELDNLIKDKDGVAQDDYLEEAIDTADSLIDSFLKKAVTVLPIPDAKVPKIIRQYSYDIATYYLHDRIQYGDIPDRVKEKYDAATNYLKDVSRGTADLGLTGEAEGDIESQTDYEIDDNIFSQNSF